MDMLLLLVTVVVFGNHDTFGQFAWTKDSHNPVFAGGGMGAWDNNVGVPWVIFNSDSARYEMWYSGSLPGGNIGFATSSDGIAWTRNANTVLSPSPGSWDSMLVLAPCVLRENGQYKMWYTGARSDWPGPAIATNRIGYATSPDGKNWTKYSGNPVLGAGKGDWESGGVEYCSVILVPGGYKMFYGGFNLSTSCIGVAFSADGITWQRDTVNNPVFTKGPPGTWDGNSFLPRVLAIGGKYFMWYGAETVPGVGPPRIGLATSIDSGKTWVRYAQDPVLTVGSSGSWDVSWVEPGSVLLVGNTVHMWYDGGAPPANLSRIGLATSQFTAGIVRRVPAQYPTIQAAINAAANNDTVLVSDGTYYENIRFKGKRIIVGSTYLTTGDTSHISKTIIDGSHATSPDSSSVVSFIDGEDTTSVLCGFTITGGRGTILLLPFPSLQGGGVLCYESGARLTKNIITGNILSDSLDRHGVFGVGVSADGSGSQVLLMEGNTVTGNSGTSVTHFAGGGGIGMYFMKGILRQNVITNNSLVTQTSSRWAAGGGVYGEQGTLIADGNVIARNNALCPNITGGFLASGGGMFVEAMDLDFRNNRVIGNVAQSSSSRPAVGGGLLMFAGDLSELRNCSVTGNYFASNQAWGSESTSGGGIDVYNENARIENNIIVKNIAAIGGGVGIHRNISATGSPTLINNTIAFNRATSGTGGGIYSQVSPSPVVINTIAWGDTGTQEIALYNGTGIWVHNCDIKDGWPSDPSGISVDPKFIDSTYRLSDSSKCIGGGTDSTQIGSQWYRAPGSDFYGSLRPNPAGTKPDIGACENPRKDPLVVGVAQEGAGLPLVFALEQNYPNPFNPSTTIRYGLPHKSQVSLMVYNTLGQLVSQLVSGEQEAGYHEVKFAGSGLASGVYFYRVNAGSFVQTRSMVLLK